MPKKYDSCVKQIEKKILEGKIKKTFEKEGKILKSNPHAICKQALKGG